MCECCLALAIVFFGAVSFRPGIGFINRKLAKEIKDAESQYNPTDAVLGYDIRE